MARIRSIKPGFFTNDQLAEVDPLGRLLFAGLWCHADRSGRLEDRPRKIKAEVLPYDNCDVDAMLTVLADQKFIIRYEVAGVRLIQVINFEKHQTPNIKEIASTLPPPPRNDTTDTPTLYQHSAETVQARHLTVLEQEQIQEQDQSLGQEGVQGGPGGGTSVPRQAQASRRPVRAVPKPKDEPAPVNPWWDALVDGIGITPATDQERQLYGKTVRELRALDASPEEILRRCSHYRARFPNAELTCTALTKHWSRVEHPPPEPIPANGVYDLTQRPSKTQQSLAAIANFDPTRRHP